MTRVESPADTLARLPSGSVERWAYDYVRCDDWASKLNPPPTPAIWVHPEQPVRIEGPGRGSGFRLADRSPKTPSSAALRRPERRAQLLHTFLHHELQAAELMCWALLTFPETPAAFRRGLLQIAQDEIRHMGLYAAHIASLGAKVGQFPVNDWFWQRLSRCRSPLQYVAAMGLGFEAGNLDHTQRFAARFRGVGDEIGAALQERVGHEEIAHVAFAAHWFGRFAGALDFDTWQRVLPPPLSPMLMKGRPCNRRDRMQAGMPKSFIEALETWQPR